MNWKLIFSLSIFGIVIAFADVLGFTRDSLPFIWLAIFVFYAFLIVRFTESKYFLHGFLVSLINGFWIAIIHGCFFKLYLSNNPEMSELFLKIPHFTGAFTMVFITGPMIGAALGLFSGFLAYLRGLSLKKYDKGR